MKRKYGWKPQGLDQRDRLYSMVARTPIKLPHSVDLRPKLPGCWDQGQLGSCTAHGIAGALVYDEKIQKETFVMPSRLFIYYGERAMEGTIPQDAGANIRDGIKFVNSQGFPDEKLWPYDIKKFTVEPPQSVYDAARKHYALQYEALDNRDIIELKECLARGLPFVFGFSVFSEFESEEMATTGVLNLPRHNEKPLGGHCVLCAGYDDVSSRFTVRNSWGADWGKSGYFTMPYAYMTNVQFAEDFWAIQKIS